VISTACNQFNTKLVIATIPHRGKDAYAQARGSWFEGLASLRRAVNASTREFCEASGDTLIDLERIFQGRADLFYDQFHLNAKGAEVVGEALAVSLSFVPEIYMAPVNEQ
jgi:lysophospholipase L1-like esterase